jgi:hypothetical protein
MALYQMEHFLLLRDKEIEDRTPSNITQKQKSQKRNIARHKSDRWRVYKRKPDQTIQKLWWLKTLGVLYSWSVWLASGDFPSVGSYLE